METCLVIEDGKECIQNPRWIEEDWPEWRQRVLRRQRHAFECHPGSFSREIRLSMSEGIIGGQVCRHHSRQYYKRLRTLLMIRGDANGDLRDPVNIGLLCRDVQIAVARAARERTTKAARSVTSVQARHGQVGSRYAFEDRLSIDPHRQVFSIDILWINTDIVRRLSRIINHYRTLAHQRVEAQPSQPTKDS